MQRRGNVKSKYVLNGKPLHPALEKYFWDHTWNASSDTFKLKRLFEYASFPDLIKIPFDFVKSNIHRLDPEKLRAVQTRRRFVREIQNYIDESTGWDETVFKIAGIK
jgi:hypothetical protein